MKMLTFVRRGLPTIIVLVVLGAAWFVWHEIATHHLDPHVEEVASEDVRTQVELSPAKLVAANVTVASVEPHTQALSVIIPGRIAYDQTQQVSVRLGTSGIITRINVRQGDKVEAGQVLALMNSPELGSARADQMQATAELELARRQSQWDQARAEGTRKLVEAINRRQSPESIRKSFTDQQIGAAREKLLGAYNELLLAESMVTRITTVAASGALPERTMDERRSSMESRGAALKSALEQTVFDADQAAQQSQNALADAERRAEIASRRVSTLLGAAASARDSKLENNSPQATDSSDDLSMIEIRSPRSGTIEQKLFNENERVGAGDVLFVVADTSRLWLNADVRESQWTALALKAGQQIKVTSPALPDETLVATVVMMGREVDPQTNAVSLVASIDNAYGRLRPGLYVRVELPMGETSSQIIVPDSAIATHEGMTFVFVTTDEKIYTRRDVRIGKSHDGQTEIIAGLQPGERIATSGVFHLKSELLLESEE